MFLGPREVVCEPTSGHSGRPDKMLDSGIEILQFSTNCRAISSVKACSALATAPCGGSCGAQACPSAADEAPGA